MRQLFKKFILIIFVGLVFCCNFNCECSRCNGILDKTILDKQISLDRIESIDAFDNANLRDVARNILPGNVFGQNINAVGVINDMVNAYLNKGCPMIALMRISIVYKDGKVVHHNVPYVFVSGGSSLNAIERWKKIPKTYISQYTNLSMAINNQKTGYGYKLNIASTVKGINDYGFWCDLRFSRFYSHAERACILALMSDEVIAYGLVN